ncbi:MAG TPA: TetR/AcrR family transcriptional regulator [Stellaceae bacterium]|nr:TetR/AcrR family transcriptional regulator [Stellaceae bacterium]
MTGRTETVEAEASAATATAAARRGPGRKRDEATRHAILRAAYETLEAEGYGGFTIEAVAARSGAAKTTIYRWWPSKGALAIDSFLDLYKREVPFPRTHSASEDLKANLRLMAKIWGGQYGRLIAGIIAAGQSDVTTLERYRERLVKPRREEGRGVLQRGIDNGEFRPDIDIEAALDALYGPFYGRLLAWLEPLDPTWAERLCDTVLRGLMV